MARGGPWVNMALLCRQSGLDEAGRPFISGQVDSLTLLGAGPRPPLSERRSILGHLLLALELTAGDARGDVHLRIDIQGEDGLPEQGSDTMVHFEGPRDGARMELKLSVPFWLSGDYWVNVIANGRLLTRVPFHVTLRWSDDADE